MLLEEVVQTSAAVTGISSRLGKVEALASCLSRARPQEVPIAVAYLSGVLPHAPIGVGWAALRALPAPAAAPSLELTEVDAELRHLGETSGRGSQSARKALLADVFGRATEAEQRFLARLLLGELRQGALEGVMVDAVARASGVASSAIRRAAMLTGDPGAVATAAIVSGDEGLAAFRIEVLRPIQPMLAQTADDLDRALARIGNAALEWKLDGARIQAHRLGDEVRVFTRNLADVTDRVPEIVESLAALPVEAIVLDGEAIALADGGRPHAFQVTMSRFGSKVDVDALRRSTPLSGVFFDCLHLEGEDLIDRPAYERVASLAGAVPASMLVRRIDAHDSHEAARFLADALAQGHEGVMVKALDAPYEAGRRGGSWLKVKQARTLDLVVLAAEWGHGRRQGKLSNLHLGAREPETGGLVMLGKTFKGMTDAMLEWQTERLLELETHRSGNTVHVRPELVVEVAFEGVQRSTRYPGGVALRFARVKGYRPDKRLDEADTIDAVRGDESGLDPRS